MWNPKPEGLKELLSLFIDSKCNDNLKQKEVYYKINEYSRNYEFINYLLYIFNEENLDIEIRQISGLTLKSILEKEYNSINDMCIGYFKSNVLKNYLHPEIKIRKTISILLNTFLIQGGIEIWPELLDFLYENLETETIAETSLETLNFILEDSGCIIEKKFDKFFQKYVLKLLKSLETSQLNLVQNENIVLLILTSLEILIENCTNSMIDLIDKTINVLICLNVIKSLNIRYKAGRCWMSIIRIKPETLVKFFEILFSFFSCNLTIEHYELNFNSADFFFLVIEDENFLIKNDQILNIIKNNLKSLLNQLMHFMKLTNNDICGIENTFKSTTQFTPKSENYITVQDESTVQKEEFVSESYNPNTTLRKLCARSVDKLSVVFPMEIFQFVKDQLECDMKNHDLIIREKSILALGAIGRGSYEYLKQHLSNIIPFLIIELQNPNKPIRAISCWTISRFASFILLDNLSENANELFKNCLAEILKRIMDTEPMVQEAACSTFSNLISTKKEKLEPYLNEIFQVLTSIFDKYKGNSMLNLYDIITYMTEEYSDCFKNKELAEPLIRCIINKWFSTSNQDYINLIPTIEVLGSVLKVSGNIIAFYCEDFYKRTLKIIEEIIKNFQNNNCDINFLDKEMISKCIDMISILCNTHSDQIQTVVNQSDILNFMLTLIASNNYEIKHYVMALLGDLTKTNNTILSSNFDEIMLILINHLECPPNINKYDKLEMAKLHVCNNTCWTIGLLAIAYKDLQSNYIEAIMMKLLKILCVARLNKSLAQNVSICIGRLAMANPEKISKFLDSFLKQFCLSLRVINNSIEKQEAFIGLCQSILYNPNGVINHFAYFCDAICNYDNAPAELENVFHKLLHSYKSSLSDKWINYFQNFPIKLQKKLIYRFKIE